MMNLFPTVGHSQLAHHLICSLNLVLAFDMIISFLVGKSVGSAKLVFYPIQINILTICLRSPNVPLPEGKPPMATSNR